MTNAPEIEGAAEVVQWFGYWPTFHDAEVLSISLDRSTGCRVAIHAFERMSGLDSRGYYALAKHAVVTFTLEGFPTDVDGIVNTRVEYFNHQNVLAEAAVEVIRGGFALALHGIYGVTGRICGERMRVSIEPGHPHHAHAE